MRDHDERHGELECVCAIIYHGLWCGESDSSVVEFGVRAGCQGVNHDDIEIRKASQYSGGAYHSPLQF